MAERDGIEPATFRSPGGRYPAIESVRSRSSLMRIHWILMSGMPERSSPSPNDGYPHQNSGSLTRTRTWDAPVNSRLLYQLSYEGTHGGDPAVKWSQRRLARPVTRPHEGRAALARCAGLLTVRTVSSRMVAQGGFEPPFSWL